MQLWVHPRSFKIALPAVDSQSKQPEFARSASHEFARPSLRPTLSSPPKLAQLNAPKVHMHAQRPHRVQNLFSSHITISDITLSLFLQRLSGLLAVRHLPCYLETTFLDSASLIHSTDVTNTTAFCML